MTWILDEGDKANVINERGVGNCNFVGVFSLLYGFVVCHTIPHILATSLIDTKCHCEIGDGHWKEMIPMVIVVIDVMVR